MWASLDLPSRTPRARGTQAEPNVCLRLSSRDPTHLVFADAHPASHHLTSFLRLLVLTFCFPLLLLLLSCSCCCRKKRSSLLHGLQLVLSPLPHTLGPTHYCCLSEPKRDCPVLPIIFNSTTHQPLHVTTAFQWPSTIALDASCTHAPTCSPHSRPNTLVAPRCCPPVSP